MKNPFRKLLRVFGLSSYEAANPSIRRGHLPGAAPADAKKELTTYTRRELVRRSRYLHKNSGFVREVVNDMAIYSTGDGIKPQAQTVDAQWNKAAEDYFRRWSERCEITRRFSFDECQALACRAMDIDGEYFVLKVRDRADRPRLQLIESHRVGDAPLSDKTVDGVIVDAFGAPVAYRILQDDGSYRDIPANAVMHIFEPEWASGSRNVPTLQHSINHILDEMEMLALEKHAVKDNSDISRILKTDTGEIDERGDFNVPGGNGGNSAPSDPKALQRIVGGKVVALKTGESLDTFQSNRPSSLFTGFLEHLKKDSSAGVLPYEFVLDPGSGRSAGIRLVVAKADRRFSFRQLILIKRFLKPTWGWIIGDAIDKGELEAVPDWNKVAWVCPKRVTVDAGREAQQHRADVETGLITWSDHFSELGMDFGDEIERRAQDARAIMDAATKYGIPLSMLWKPSGTQIVTDMGGVDKPAEEETET